MPSLFSGLFDIPAQRPFPSKANMPGHVGRMRPVKRRHSNDGEGLDFPVITHGRPAAGSPYSFYHKPSVVSFRRLITPIPWGKLGFEFKDVTPAEMPSPIDQPVFPDRPHTSNGKGVEAGYGQSEHVKNVEDIFQPDGLSSHEGSTSQDFPMGRGVYARDGLYGMKGSWLV